MSDIELKPCPFCGGNRIIIFKTAKNRGYATCIECGARTRGCGNYEHKDDLRWKERAVRLWNIRKPMEQIVEQLEEERSIFNNTDWNVAMNKAIKIVEGGVEDETE